jgi:hypothetical protein
MKKPCPDDQALTDDERIYSALRQIDDARQDARFRLSVLQHRLNRLVNRLSPFWQSQYDDFFEGGYAKPGDVDLATKWDAYVELDLHDKTRVYLVRRGLRPARPGLRLVVDNLNNPKSGADGPHAA